MVVALGNALDIALGSGLGSALVGRALRIALGSALRIAMGIIGADIDELLVSVHFEVSIRVGISRLCD